MSGSGFRGRGFGPRGARSNGPTNGFTGPRFPFPNFNHPWPQHRLPGPEKWIEGPNFAPWQKNNNFVPRPHYRGNLQFRQNNRGRAINGRGRPPASQFCLTRNPGLGVPVPQEEQVVKNDKPVSVPLLPGSEEERQHKITETADKLKQKLSSIKPEELTNFWEDDLSILPNSDFKEENTLTKGIPELRHEPPELNLSYTDFRDIGKVDSKFDNVEDKINSDDIIITFEGKTTDAIASTNNEHIVINEDQDESLTILDSTRENDVLCESNSREEIFDNLPNSECNSENLHLRCNNVTEIAVSLDENNADETLSVSTIDEKIISFTPTKPTDDLINEKSLDLDDTEVIPVSVSVPNDQDQNKNTLELDKQNIDTDIIQVTNVDLQQNDHLESDLHQLQVNVPEEEVCQISASTSDSLQNNSVNLPPPSEDIQSNIVRDSKSPTYSIYNETPKLNNPPAFQLRVFNVPPRFGPRIPGARNRWPFQQNGNSLFFRGPQRLPFRGNRMPRIPYEYNPTDLVPPAFDPRAPPPFTHNVPATSHDSQHLTLVPFSTKDLPPTFDPSEPPPNIRTTSVTESSNRQEIAQTMPPLDSRNQTKTTPLNNMENMQPPAFDPRGPPPKISNVIAKTNENLPEFNPQQPPPKIHKRDETLQPPPIFDPRLSSQERSKLIAPLNPAGSHMMGMKIMETSQLPVLNITPVTANFSHPPPTMPTHQGFMPALPVNFPPVLPQVNSGQVMVQEFGLPPPPINITEIAPLPSQELLSEKNSNHHQGINMDDGLEDMQEAMEFAKEIMKMNQGGPSGSEASFTPSEIPVPIEDIPCLSIDQTNVNTMKKQKKKDNKNKKSKQNIICGPELNLEKQGEAEIMDEEQSVQIQTKNIHDTILTDDQIRPKVMFNLNSKTKIIQKPEEWRRTIVNIPENKEASRYLTTQNSRKEKKQSKKYSFERKRNNINQIKDQEKEYSLNTNLKRCTEIAKTPVVDKSNDRSHHQDYLKDSEKMYSYSLNIPLSNNIGVQKIQKSKKEVRKAVTPISESSWKGRVISRFLKMSKNDICNMVNNSSLRKFDIAMKHLVKEKRSSMSLEMRNTEDEKMKEYDREEFMNQLNAMLDPSAVVGITDLPTEFIHHLSEVLQLDLIEDTLEDTNSSKKSLLNKSNPEAEATHKLQTPLFNEADLDDILSQVTERTRTPAQIQPVTKSSEDNAQFSNSTVADLDDIFSAGIARAKSLSKSGDLANTRVRKSSSEDQIRFRSERGDRNKQEDPDIFRHEMWNNNHDMNNDQGDTFRSEKYEYMCRNLTKEEWEAKYGSANATTASTMRKTSSNSDENLNRDSRYCQSQRYYSSDSHMRRLSMSPLSHEPPAYDLKRCSITLSNDLEDVRRTEQSDSNSDSNTSSTSDTEEETVAPDVTKLLKVIKENEKMAKKKTLNETIRDEVAAEIEKKWKEKSKYKERKLRKRDKRKRDRREKQKKRRRRNRNSHSEMSKSSEQSEEFRLLTEDEIKKEVVIKKEPLSTAEETVPQMFAAQTNTTLVVPVSTYKVTEAILQIESQSLAIEKQQFPVITCNKTPPQVKVNSTAISVTMHPKTKAQLKQMPEFSNLVQKDTIKKPSEVGMNANTENIEEQVEKSKGSEINTNEIDNKGNGEENKDSETDTSLPANNSLPQLNVSLNVTKQPHTETTSDNTTNTASYNAINPVTEISISSHSSDQKAPLTSTSSTEIKSGYRKIDIKAYKERALQRRLKEEAKLNENFGVSVSLPYNSHDSPIKKIVNETATLATMNKLQATEVDINKVQLKDPRLGKVKSTSQSADSSLLEIPNKEDTEKDSSTEKLLHTGVFQNNEQLLTPVQSKSANEGIAVKVKDTEKLFTLPATFELIPLKDSDSPKDHKCDAKPLNEAQEKIVNHELVDLQIQEESKVESVESKKLPATNESNKFKNIRSEGSKELKLKKDKKSTEKKKKKSPKSKSLIEEGLKHPNKTEIENFSESEVRVENVAIEHSINCRINKKLINSHFTIVEKNDKRDAKNDEVKTDIDTRITENQQITNVVEDENLGNQQITDQRKIEITDDKDLINVKMEENSVKEIGENRFPSFEVNGTSSEPDAIVQLDKKENKGDVKEEVFSFNDTQIQIYTTNTTFSTVNPCYMDKKLHSPKDNIDLNNSVNVKSDSNTTPDLRIDLEVLGNSKTKLNDVDQDDDTSTSVLKDLQTVDDFSKAEKNEVRSPDSTGSPFKGFLIEGDIKEPAIEDPKKWLKICLNEELDEESRREVKEMNEPASENTLVEKQSSTTTNATEDSYIETVAKALETRDNNTGVNQDNSSSILESDSQGTFDENGEPFIVLDEYIDDTDDRSIEKLSNLDLDLDDCISKNMDIFSSRPLPEVESSIDNVKSSDFNSIDFKQLSDVFGTDDLMSVEQAEESTSIDRNSNIKELSVNRKQNSENIVTAVSQLKIDVPLITEKNLPNTDISGNNLQHNFESSDLESVTASPEIQTTLNVVKTALAKSLENLSGVTASTPEMNVEFTNLNEETSELNRKIVNIDKESSVLNKGVVEVNKNTYSEISESNERVSENLKNTVKAIKEITELNKKILDKGPISYEKSNNKVLNHSSRNKINSSHYNHIVTKDQKSSSKSDRRKDDKALHKVRSKHRLKHKHQKKRSISKKTIEEAVQSDNVKVKYPTTKEAIMARMIEIDLEIHKLMTEKMTLYKMLKNDTLATDQLIQNIDAIPVTNQCSKMTTETVPTKDTVVNPVHMNKSKVSKHEHHTGKRARSIFDDEEIANTFKKRKKHKGTEKAGKCDDKPESVPLEEKQSIDTAKSILKKASKKQETDEKVTEQIESQVSCDELVKLKMMDQVDETASSLKDSEDASETLNDTDTASSVTKTLEIRTPERSSIYSDDSTWDSLFQTPSDDQKKPATGLALLEETYRKEIAKTRRVRIEARRRRKQKIIRSLPPSVNALTPEEEELPLSALYAKKVHHKKKILGSLNPQLEKTNDDQQLWKNVDEVINAVAENRTEVLYRGRSERRSSDEGRQNYMPDVDDACLDKEQVDSAKVNSESKLLRREENVILLSKSKSQDLPNDGEQADLVSVESQNMENSPDTSMISSIEQTMEDNNLEIRTVTSIESSDDINKTNKESNLQKNIVDIEGTVSDAEQVILVSKRKKEMIPSTSPIPLSHDEEVQNNLANVKKSCCIQKTVSGKRSMPRDDEITLNPLALSNEIQVIKKCRHTILEMINCKVKLVDSKHTILKPNVNPNLLRMYGISKINSCMHPNYIQISTSTPEFSRGQSPKLIKKQDDVTRTLDNEDYLIKDKRKPKSITKNLHANDKEKCTDLNKEVMPVLTKEQIVVDISENREKLDIEIVTKNQHQNESGSTVIETIDNLPRMQYTVHKGPILDIKVFENSFLAASEDGRIYRYSQISNGILNIYKGHTAAVTCLYVYNANSTDINKEWMFSGSLDGTLRCYNVTTGEQPRDTADIGSPIQCMDEAWGIIFIGTKSGHVSRYHVKSGVIKGNSIQFSDKSVLALKATNEGPRRVLIVASRSQPITIRDAQNGLFLRTICGEKNHTVYSLMLDNNLIYCGTSTTSILVFDFTNGDQIIQYNAGVGIVCMRLYKQLLFAGCYDGNIYVFNIKDHRLVCSIPGPGNMLLSMEVIENKIIAGSKDKRLQLWQMAHPVRALLYKLENQVRTDTS